MKLFTRRRLLRAVIIYAVLGAMATVLTTVERRRIRSSVTAPDLSAPQGPIDGRALLADVERLASPAFEGRRTGTSGNKAAQEFITARFRSMNAAPLFGSYRQPFSFTRRSIKGFFSPSRPYETHYPDAANLGAVIRGTSQPERFLAIVAHYDGLGIKEGRIFPGADDNGSGIAVMLAVGDLVARQPLRHSLLLLAVDAEELGLQGAMHFVANSPVDLGLIDTVVSLDMVGRGDENVLVAAGTSLYPALEAPVRTAAGQRRIKVMFGHDRPFYRAGLVDDWTHSSDHGPFHEAGVPFVYFGVEDHADYHRATDTADRIPPAFLGEVGNFVLRVIGLLDAAGNAR